MVVIGSLLTLEGNAAPPTTDPYQIFQRASEVWVSQRYPLYLHYAIKVSVTDAQGVRTEAYQSAYNAVTGQIWVDPISDYERAHPASTRGFRFCFNSCSGPQPAPHTDFFGVPKLSPVYAFGVAAIPRETLPPSPTPDELVREIRREFNDPMPAYRVTPTPHPSLLPEIVTVTTTNRNYNIWLDGEQVINGIRCFHLGLSAVRDPGTYRLREVWIDEGSFHTVRVVQDGNFTDGPGTGVRWMIDFSTQSSPLYALRETSLGIIRYGSERYSQVVISFADMQSIPDPQPTTLVGAYLILREP
jgi:hypothetical protein